MFDTKNLVKKFSDKVSGREGENYEENIDIFNQRMKDWPFKSNEEVNVNSNQSENTTSLAVEGFIQQETGVFDLDQLERESASVNVANESSGSRHSVTQMEEFKKMHLEIVKNYFLCEKIIDELKEIRQNAEKYGQEFDVLDYIKSLETIYSTKFKTLFNSIYDVKNL